MAEQRPCFEVIDHTAEIGIAAYGGTMAQAFENAAVGMFSLIVDPSQVQETDARQITVEGRDREGLLINWLSELVYLFEVDGLLFKRFHIEDLTEQRLAATAYGEPFDPNRHQAALGIKAVTRHMLEVAPDDGGYRVQVIFDV